MAVVWECFTEDGPVLDPDIEEETPLLRPTKGAILKVLKYLLCGSKHKARRVCQTCYEVSVLEDLAGEWSQEYRVQTALKKDA